MKLKWTWVPLLGALACGPSYPLWPGDAGNQTIEVATTTVADTAVPRVILDAGPEVLDAGSAGVVDAGDVGVVDAGPCRIQGNICTLDGDCCSNVCSGGTCN